MRPVDCKCSVALFVVNIEAIQMLAGSALTRNYDQCARRYQQMFVVQTQSPILRLPPNGRGIGLTTVLKAALVGRVRGPRVHFLAPQCRFAISKRRCWCIPVGFAQS